MGDDVEDAERVADLERGDVERHVLDRSGKDLERGAAGDEELRAEVGVEVEEGSEPAPGAAPKATYVDARRSSDGLDVDRAACVKALKR